MDAQSSRNYQTREYIFKLLNTGETVVLTFSPDITLAEFIHAINNDFKERYGINEYKLIEGGTKLAEEGQIYDFRNVPTRITTLFQFFGNTNTFYIYSREPTVPPDAPSLF